MKIEVRGLTKTFGQVTAVQDVSFTAPAGKVTGFLGPNGSGKPSNWNMTLFLVARCVALQPLPISRGLPAS